MQILAQNNSPADYTHFNFALLKCRGTNEVFNTLRYERAFFARSADVNRLRQLMGAAATAILTELELLIAAYSWNNRPHWTYGRLLSTMSLTELKPHELYDLNADFTIAKAAKRLKVRSDITVEGTAPEIMQFMLENRGMPAREEDAHRLEHTIYDPDKPITMTVTLFATFEHDWLLTPVGSTR
jgi:hypothetical protein